MTNKLKRVKDPAVTSVKNAMCDFLKEFDACRSFIERELKAPQLKIVKVKQLLIAADRVVSKGKALMKKGRPFALE